MDTKHTPGHLIVRASAAYPRQFHIESDVDSAPYEAPFDDIYVNLSGYVGSYGPHVFAAAPDMLEALQSFPGFTDDATVGDAWIEKMRAAIARATGAA